MTRFTKLHDQFVISINFDMLIVILGIEVDALGCS